MSELAHGRAHLSGSRIGINAHLLAPVAGYRRAGIHRYISEILRHLPVVAPDAAYLVYAPAAVQVEELGNPHLRAVPTRWPTEQRLARILWEQTAWPLQIVRDRLDLLHSMAFVTPLLNRVPEIVTVYDLSFLKYPEAFPSAQRRYLQLQTARSVHGARRVITISEASRRDLHELFGVPLAAVDVVYPGVDACYRPLPAADVAAFRAREALPQHFFLHVGTLQPRKNIPVLLEALARLERPEALLVLIGGKGWMYDDIFALVESLGLRDQVRFTDYVPDADLPLWYNAATALVFPSLYEGFGLPVLEALACGTAVIAARASSIPEAGGDAAHYFDPHDVVALTEQLAALLEADGTDVARRDLGLGQARAFSWERAAAATADIYRKVLLAL